MTSSHAGRKGSFAELFGFGPEIPEEGGVKFEFAHSWAEEGSAGGGFIREFRLHHNGFSSVVPLVPRGRVRIPESLRRR